MENKNIKKKENKVTVASLKEKVYKVEDDSFLMKAIFVITVFCSTLFVVVLIFTILGFLDEFNWLLVVLIVGLCFFAIVFYICTIYSRMEKKLKTKGFFNSNQEYLIKVYKQKIDELSQEIQKLSDLQAKSPFNGVKKQAKSKK